MNEKLKNEIALVLLSVFALISFMAWGERERIGVWLRAKGNSPIRLSAIIAKPVSAQEIYPMFVCPCCGKPLDPQKICCGEAQERIDFIDQEVASRKPKDEVVIDFVKKYGLRSFANKNMQEEFRDKVIQTLPDSRPAIVVTPSVKDLGVVSQKRGIVSTMFELKNAGKIDLVINRLSSSCGCASAAVVYQGVEGPRFAMAGHGIVNPSDWQITIPPEASAQLKVYYDPTVHPDLRGSVTREIYVYSNDPLDFEKTVQLELSQAD